MVYLYDVIVLSNLVEKHLRPVAELLRSLERSHVSLRLSKCKLPHTKVTHIGRFVRHWKLKIEDCAIKSLKEALFMRNKELLRVFFGLRSVYRHFGYNFADTAYPLNDMLQKRPPKVFDKRFVKQLCSFE